MKAVDITQLSHTYPAARRVLNPRKVLIDLSFSVEPGEIFGLLGPNGGGKTTLFKILSTMLVPSKGDATIFGSSVSSSPNEVRKKIGVVFQYPSLDKKLTVAENINHQADFYGIDSKTLESRRNELLTRLSLKDRSEDFVEHLSGGLQRRVEIAKGLLHRPALLLMDEPSTGLDPGARREMWDYLKTLTKEGITVLLTTHLMEEGDKCDRLGILHKGNLVAMGTPEQLKSKIGGDVITIHTKNPDQVSKIISEKFQVSARTIDGIVRVEKNNGHQFIPQVVEACPQLIESISTGRPTLEDVFVKETGQTLYQENVSESGEKA